MLVDIKFIENRYALILEEAHLSLIDLSNKHLIYSFHPLPHHMLAGSISRPVPRLQLLLSPQFSLLNLPCVVILSKDHSSVSFEDFAGSGAHGFLDLPTDISTILGELDLQWASLAAQTD